MIHRDVEGRLVTLVGELGSGRTRIALAVAHEVQIYYPDGVWFVDLHAVSDPLLVDSIVAETLGLRETEGRPARPALVEYLRRRRLLLVFAGCMPVQDACASLVREILGACPRVSVIATSDRAFGLEGEELRVVPSLAGPEHQQQARDLLLAAAARNSPEYVPGEDAAPALAAIIGGVRGNPLALALAGARLPAIEPARIAAELADSHPATPDARHAPLPSHLLHTILWSASRLPQVARDALWSLAILPGGWTAPAAAAVALNSYSPDGLARVRILLRELEAAALIQREVGAKTERYRMPSAIRQVALSQRTGREGILHRRRLAWYRQLVEQANRERIRAK